MHDMSLNKAVIKQVCKMKKNPYFFYPSSMRNKKKIIFAVDAELQNLWTVKPTWPLWVLLQIQTSIKPKTSI